MGILADIREQIRLRLVTVQVPSGSPVRVFTWDAEGADLGARALTIGIPSSAFGQGGDPLAPNAEVGRWGWELTWPIALYVARTEGTGSIELVDHLQQEVVEALMSDQHLGGTALATAIGAASVDDTPDADTRRASHHIVAWDLVVLRYVNH